MLTGRRSTDRSTVLYSATRASSAFVRSFVRSFVGCFFVCVFRARGASREIGRERYERIIHPSPNRLEREERVERASARAR